MKKLLSILGTITLLGTISANIIACNNNSNNDIKYEINDKGEIMYNFQEKQAYIRHIP